LIHLALERAIAARDALNVFIDEFQTTDSMPAAKTQTKREKLPRAPNGIHLTAEGLAELESYFASGHSAWEAHQNYDISYRAASLRFASWSKKTKKK